MDALSDQLHIQGLDPLEGVRFLVRKRDGRVEEFNEARILLAIESAFKAHHRCSPDKPLPAVLDSAVKTSAAIVVERVLGRAVRGEELEIERIQDAVEDQLMTAGHLEVARRYILYREQRRQARAEREGRARPVFSAGQKAPPPPLTESPALRGIYSQTFAKPRAGETVADLCRRYFDCFLNEGDYFQCLTPQLLEFDSAALAKCLRADRDSLLGAAGLGILQSRYLAREKGRILETPQYFWMRVAMGLALAEGLSGDSRAIEFYDTLSSLRFIPSEPILLHAGTPHPVLSAAAPGSAGEWLEPWHRDLFSLLQPPPTGWKGLWLPDLFMKRVREGSHWTLFDPPEVPALAACHGSQFEKRYEEYERDSGQLRFARQVPAAPLWNEILSRMQAGHLALGFKDTISTRALQNSGRAIAGVTLEGRFWNAGETGACPAGAINLAAHVASNGAGLDLVMLRQTVRTAIRLLDNALDLEAGPGRSAGLAQRAVGLGIIGLPEALARIGSDEPGAMANFAGETMELISFYAIMASAELAGERGPYPNYSTSRWSEGILPLDTIAPLVRNRGSSFKFAAGSQDWELARAAIRRNGIRNCAVTVSFSEEGPALLAGVSPLASFADGASMECLARLQQWTDRAHPVSLPFPEFEPAAVGRLCLQAWEKGLMLIRPFRPMAVSAPAAAPANPPVSAPAERPVSTLE